MQFITLDFETFYSKDFKLPKLTIEEYVRDPRFEIIGVGVKVNDEEPVWFSGTMEETGAFLHQFDIPNSFLLGHNNAFDAFILQHHFGIKARFYFCTLSMAKPLHGQTIGVSLKALSDHYTVGMKGDEVHLAMGKRRLDFTPEALADYGRYCCNDVQLCYIIFHIIKKELPEAEIRIIDLMLRMFVDPVLELDSELLVEHLENVRTKKEKLLSKVTEIAGPDALMSNPKFAELLMTLGVEPPMKPSPRNPAKQTFAFAKTDIAFKELLQHEDPCVQAVVAARLGVKSTLEETRTRSMLEIASRGTLPIYLNYYGAHTGRASGGDGVNPQNLPRGGTLRKAIKAPDGHILIACDSTAIEARMLAWLAGQDDLVAEFAKNADVYSLFASDVYGYPVLKKTHPTERFVGKTCILGLGYQTGAVKLKHTLAVANPPVRMDDSDCKRIVSLYRSKYSQIPQLWSSGDWALHAILRGERYVFGRNKLLFTSKEGIHLPNGMVLRYPSLVLHSGRFAYARNKGQQAEWVRQQLSGERDVTKLTQIYGGKVIENVVQALARIVVFEQMLSIAERYRTVLTVHDEVVVCVPEEQAEEAEEFVRLTMSTPPSWGVGLPVACEANTGRTYGEAK
jgi:DNA polymerase